MIGSLIDTGGLSAGAFLAGGALAGVAGRSAENAVLGRGITVTDVAEGSANGMVGGMMALPAARPQLPRVAPANAPEPAVIGEGTTGAEPTVKPAIGEPLPAAPEAASTPANASSSTAAPATPAGSGSSGTAQSTKALSQGVVNNIKGTVAENVSDSAARRSGEFPFFRAQRRGGMDFGVLVQDETVILRETKAANRLQFDDFTAITQNLQSNMAEIRDAVASAPGLTRENKALLQQTLDAAIRGETPANLRIQVETAKAPVGPKLQARIRENTGGIPVEFTRLPRP